jgi:hypothetical protein
LTCSGKADGLGNGPTAAFLTADSVSASYECVNKGGNVAPGQPVVLSNVTGPTQNITPQNGQITFSPTLPPDPERSNRVPQRELVGAPHVARIHERRAAQRAASGDRGPVVLVGTIDP